MYVQSCSNVQTHLILATPTFRLVARRVLRIDTKLRHHYHYVAMKSLARHLFHTKSAHWPTVISCQCDRPIADSFRARARASVRIFVYSNHNTLGISVVSRTKNHINCACVDGMPYSAYRPSLFSGLAWRIVCFNT
ncbi:hypothetical protein PUN28_003016 [Cardiocondyla obscurior]|uniref:Uncharacterized protein n=1 Tax=Cardiocondyla obscurior TaxID=286306 RepID=A0AAW2GXI1_9HYME